MENDLSLNETARNKMMNKVNRDGKVLEIGALHNPLFKKNDYDVYYADILSTNELKERFSYFRPELIERIVSVDYVLKDSYYDTFKGTDMKFDYIVSSHVLEHMPNPIDYLFDITTILNENGKVCLLLPDKEFTFDHYRENSSIADWFDVYKRGEENNIPRLFLDAELCKVNENDYIKYWNKTFSKYPNHDISTVLEKYDDFINDFDNSNYDGHYWVFTDRSFLGILANLIRLNILPYKVVSFFPTAVNDNTFGVILELDYNIVDNLNFRQEQINELYKISEDIERKRFEMSVESIIQENTELKATIKTIINIIKK